MSTPQAGGEPPLHTVDAWLLRRGQGLHRFSLQYGVYAALAFTALCVGLFTGRAYLSRSWTFLFLLWNLFLAWVPYLGALGVVLLQQRYPRQWWLALAPGLVSVAFFPNAPYIVTDFLHLTERPPVPFWYDIGMLAAFALNGLVLGIYALRILHGVVEARLGAILGWFFALSVVVLSGMGIYLGRFLRWNSWDLLTQPRAVLYDVAVRLRNPLHHPQTYGVTLLFAGLLGVCYLAVVLSPRLVSPQD